MEHFIVQLIVQLIKTKCISSYRNSFLYHLSYKKFIHL